MKHFPVTVLLLALVASPAAAQYGRGSYVAPVAPPKTITTYTYSPGVGSYNYNSYKPSYSPTPSYRPSESTPRSSRSSGRDTESSRPESSPTALPASYWLKKMEDAYAKLYPGIEDLAANVNPAELTPAERTRFYTYLMLANRSNSNYVGALTAYEEGRGKYPESLSSYTHVIATEMYYQRKNHGDYQKGVEAFSHCATPLTAPDYYRNRCLIALDQNEAAYTNLAAHTPAFYSDLTPAEYHYLLANCAMQAPVPATGRAARYQNVVASLTRYLELSAKTPQYAYLLRARAHYRLGNYQGCVDDISQQLALDPGNSGIMLWRARAYTGLRNYPAAMQDWNLLLSAEAKWSSSWNGRGWTRCLAGDFAGGLADARQALRRDSTNAWDGASFATRGYARAGLGQHAAAAADYTRGLALSPGTGLIYLLRGKSRLKLNQPALARADFAQAAKLGVEDHPDLTTADARKLLALAGGNAAPAGKKPAAPARPAAKPRN